MSSKAKSPDPQRKKRYLLIGVVVAAIVILTVVLSTVSEDEKVVAFPYLMEDDKIEVTTMFQYSGFNPDCGDEMGEDIAALSVVNRSVEHLSHLELTAEMAEGEDINFEVSDLPAGETVWVFSKDNQSYKMDTVVRSIEGEAEFEVGDPLMSDKVQIQVEGTNVTLTNLTEEDLANLTVACRTWLGEAYFGGLTYSYVVDSLPAGQTVSLDAEDCYLGEAVVVSVRAE